MPYSNYKSILPPIEIYHSPAVNIAKHQEISSRGVIFQSDDAIEIGTILSISLKQVSMTGSVDFIAKVLQCQQVSGKDSFEIHANFYGMNHAKEEEVLEFIGSNH
ncbi:MAG: hypothetical protein JJT78_12620 [Leptospira sp.]|nr:hypothetical protein [Leptospira sp.]